MKQKVQRIAWIGLMALPVLMLAMSSVMKLTGSEEIVNGLTAAGFGSYIAVLGIVELLAVVLFVIPATYKVGFLLLNGYLGGAFAVELAAGKFPVAALFLTLLWVSVFIRNRSLFIAE